jgi:phenylacetic acid degradation operon negative regulatory protein
MNRAMNRVEKNSLTYKILKAIALISEGAKDFVFSLGPLFDVLTSRKTMGQAILTIGGYSSNKSAIKTNYRTALKRLEKKGLIKFTDATSFILTKGGRDILLKFEIDDIKLPNFDPRKWDGKWRVLIFDISETIRAVRDIFRSKVQELQFYNLQKSVYVTPQPCEEEILELARMLRIEKSVQVLEVTKLGLKEKAVRKFFGIK